MVQAATELAAAPPLHGVPTLPTVRWRFVVWVALLTAMVGAMAASYLAYTASIATSGYNIQRLQAERDAWRTRNEQLRVELAKMRSLTWVEHEAVSRLKMHKPPQLTYLKIEAASEQASGGEGKPAAPR